MPWLYRISFLLGVTELVLIVASWLVTSAEPDLAMHSLLSPAGARWYFGTYVERIATPTLVYLILCAIAWSCMRGSHLHDALRTYCSPRRTTMPTQQVFALLTSIVVMVLQLATVACLTLLPHAILLSSTGALWPSSFSRSIVPAMAFIIVTTHSLYAVLSGQVRSLSQLGQLLTASTQYLSPLLLLHCLAADLWGCISYVFF